jgi:hypothetical protein
MSPFQKSGPPSVVLSEALILKRLAPIQAFECEPFDVPADRSERCEVTMRNRRGVRVRTAEGRLRIPARAARPEGP